MSYDNLSKKIDILHKNQKKISKLIQIMSDLGFGFNRIPWNVIDKRDGTMAIIDYSGNELGWITAKAWEELGNDDR